MSFEPGVCATTEGLFPRALKYRINDDVSYDVTWCVCMCAGPTVPGLQLDLPVTGGGAVLAATSLVGSWDTIIQTPAGSVPASSWIHIAYTFSTTNLAILYLNGNQVRVASHLTPLFHRLFSRSFPPLEPVGCQALQH